jgi:hypothetical protein
MKIVHQLTQEIIILASIDILGGRKSTPHSASQRRRRASSADFVNLVG